MPRGLRKRGRRHKNETLTEYPQEARDSYSYNEAEEGNHDLSREDQKNNPEPSWIISAASRYENGLVDPTAPFGFVDAEVKAYFRTVDVQIRRWQEGQEEANGDSEDVGADPNEERRLFFIAALREMQEREKQLATDPDCSLILERMAHSMDDFVRRVFMDSLAGSYEVLVKHRFGSHVCQTLVALAGDTLEREARGIYPPVPGSEDKGELRTMTQLILDICEELLPTFSSLITDPFASHVIRSLLAVLSPGSPGHAKEDQSRTSLLRSKRSASWKAKQGSMQSLFEKGKGKESSQLPRVPPQLQRMTKRLIETLISELDENEIRAMAANKTASPCLQMLLEAEADQAISNKPGSLMDQVTAGIITSCSEGKAPPEPSDYLNTLLRDITSSHLLEVIISRSPTHAFDALWNLYLEGKLPRLAVHPVANFVVAKAFERANEKQILSACQELKDSWSRLVASSRSGVLRALIERSSHAQSVGDEVMTAVFSAFKLETPEARLCLVPCALSLVPFEELRSTSTTARDDRSHGKGKPQKGAVEPQIQGSLLLQALLRLPEPQHQAVVNSITSLSIEEQIALAHNSVSSRVYDVLLSSPTISHKTKRALVMSFIGHYHQLVDDRFGSRVVDRCWDFADTYLKEKIARSLFLHQQLLAGSFYGKFFSRNLNLHLLQRKPEEWRNLQTQKKKKSETESVLPSTHPLPTAAEPKLNLETKVASPRPKKKRKHQGDEIDALFDASLGKKVKRAALASDLSTTPNVDSRMAGKLTSGAVDQNLQDVLGVLRAAPKGEKLGVKKKG